jgi:hypothetical protein
MNIKPLIGIVATAVALALVPATASAADLYEDYPVDGVAVDDDPPVVVERERIIERRYYDPPHYAEDRPAVEVYERSYRPAYYPDRQYYRTYDGW